MKGQWFGWRRSLNLASSNPRVGHHLSKCWSVARVQLQHRLHQVSGLVAYKNVPVVELFHKLPRDNEFEPLVRDTGLIVWRKPRQHNVENDASRPKINGKAIKVVFILKDLGGHVIVFPAHALRLHESSNLAVGNVGDFARIIRVGIRDAKAHAHVNDETVLLIDEYVFERKIAMANATLLKVIKALREEEA